MLVLRKLPIYRQSALAAQVTQRIPLLKSKYCTDKQEAEPQWPKRVISGIQPTGALHIGNYFGAVQNWIKLQNEGIDVSCFIADYHSITLPQDPQALRENTFELLATLIACGLDPSKSTLFLQSSVPQQTELSWILGCLATIPRLSALPQFKEKSGMVKDVNIGLFTYPILQSADILAHKATIVPCGQDQLQQLQLGQHLAKVFNNKYGLTFPVFKSMIADDASSRIRSLRNPTKKQSKSDPDPKSRVMLRDPPDVVLLKIKKAVTDCTSAVEYDLENRPGVSNLITIHSLASGLAPEEICKRVKNLDTGKYKFVVAENLISHLNPIRIKIEEYLKNKDYLLSVMRMGRERASERAERTLREVKEKVGMVNC